MAWSHLQSASNTNSSSSTIAATFTASNVISGSKLIALIALSTNDVSESVVSVKDGAGNAMTQVFTTSISAVGWFEIWAMDTPAGDVGTKPTLTVTFNASASNFGATVLIQEVSGLKAGTSGILDGTVAANPTTQTGSSGSIGTAAYSSTAASEYLLAVYMDPGSGATISTPTTGYTGDGANVSGSNSANIVAGYKNSGNGAESASFAYSFGFSGQDVITLLVAFKLPGGGTTPSGTVQPRATVPVPRRRPGRGLWQKVSGQAFVQVAAPRQQPGPAPRRRPARGVWGVVHGQAYVAVPAPRQECQLAPRRRPARAYVQFTPVTTANAAATAPPGTVQPRATVPVPRRNPARALWQHATGAAYAAVPAPAQQPRPAPRRTLARAIWRGIAGAAPVKVPAPRQQPAPAARRKPARAYIQFTPARTANAAPVTPPSGTVQPRATVPVRRRVPARALILFTPPPALAAPAVAEGGPVYYPYHHRGRGRTR